MSQQLTTLANTTSPYLETDLKEEVRISFSEFAQHILNLSPTWVQDQSDDLNALIEAPQFIRLRDAYCALVTREEHRYHPFSLLANYCQGIQPFVTFCRNDPTYIKGSGAKRKPDVVGVWPGALEWAQGDMGNLSKKGPGKKNAFRWLDVVTFMEHKKVEQFIGPLKSDKGNPILRSRSRTPPPLLPSGRTTRQAKAKASNSTSTSKDQTTSSSTSRLPTPLEASSAGSKRRLDDVDSKQHLKKRKQDSHAPVNYMVQCASYALEMMSQGGLRTHAIGGLVTDGQIELLYYDRSIVIRSHPLSFIDNPYEFVGSLQGMSQLTRSQWGFLNIIIPPSNPQLLFKDSRNLFKNFTLKLKDGLELLLLNTVFHQHGLIGRGTCVIRAQVVQVGQIDDHWKSKIVIVKFSWPAATRLSECSIVEKARQFAKDHDPAMLSRLPYILHHQDVQVKETERLSEWLADKYPQKYEKRILRITVQEELFPLTELQKVSEVASVFRDVFKCYRWLFEKVEILHRDISLNNLMYRKNSNGGLLSGVLNDYDLAIYTDSHESPSSKHRTGTRPFMAIDLLYANKPCEHLYRHDLESLFYVILLFTCRWENRKEKKGQLDDWFHLRGDALAEKKSAFLTNADVPEPTKAFASFKAWTAQLMLMFVEGQSAKSVRDARHRVTHTVIEFDNSTLGGHVTFDSFANVLHSQISY